ncbi:hypothetical protein Q7P35_002656 [Cladosporium inversicolor]
MTQRAASCTVCVGFFVYTFINRPNTDHIDYVRFFESDPATGDRKNKAVSGKIGTKDRPISAQSGPLSCTKFWNEGDGSTDIRLYFVSNGVIREAKLADIAPDSDLKNGWVVPEGRSDDKLSIMTGLGFGARGVDQTSYLSTGRTVRDKESGEPAAPYVVFQASGEPEVINYARSWGKGDDTRWVNGTLPVKLVPAQAR